jgi:hypothetical protein
VKKNLEFEEFYTSRLGIGYKNITNFYKKSNEKVMTK